MHLKSCKALKEIGRPTNSGTPASSQSSQSSLEAQSTWASAPTVGAGVSTAVGATMAMTVSTKMGVTAPTTALTIDVAVRQPEMGTFVPPFTDGAPISISIPVSPQVRPRLDDRFITMQNLSSEQPFGMSTSMMASLHNNASMFADPANPFTLYNAHNPLSSCIFGRNAPPALTTESMMSLRQQMDESNH